MTFWTDRRYPWKVECREEEAKIAFGVYPEQVETLKSIFVGFRESLRGNPKNEKAKKCKSPMTKFVKFSPASKPAEHPKTKRTGFRMQSGESFGERTISQTLRSFGGSPRSTAAPFARCAQTARMIAKVSVSPETCVSTCKAAAR